MAGHPKDHQPPSMPLTRLVDLLDGLQPMGDLRRFAIDDLTPDEEDRFFRILEEA